MQKTFNIRFKEVGTGAYKVFAPPKGYLNMNPVWEHCPQIEGCPFSEFLDGLNFTSAEERILKVTLHFNSNDLDSKG